MNGDRQYPTIDAHLTKDIVKYLDSHSVCLSFNEVLCIANTILSVPFCKLLIFGVGNDSGLWISINLNGETVFLEDDDYWISKISGMHSDMNIFKVEYPRHITKWKDLLNKPEQLTISLPNHVLSKKWDVIFVDAPLGNYDLNKKYICSKEEPPGRMHNIFMASRLINKEGFVLVHDCGREIENAYCNKFLGKNNLTEEVIGGYRANKGVLRKYRNVLI